MEITHDTPPPEISETPPKPGRAGPTGWWRALVCLIFLGSFGVALMRMGNRQRERLEADPDQEELRSLQALWDTKPQHERPWQPATNGWYQARAPHATWDGVPPLWPWLMSFGGPAHGDESAGLTLMELQEAGSPLPAWVEELRVKVWHTNQWLTLGFLGLLAMGVGRQWSLLGTVNLMLVLGWVVLWPIEARATPETLSMILLLLTSLCAVRLLQKNTAWRHVHFGLLAGLTYLTDLAIIQMLAAWLLVTAARFLRGALDKSPEGAWTCRGHFIGLLAMVFAFVAVAAPNLFFHRVHDGKALSPALRHYEKSVPQSTEELRSRTLESLQTIVKSNSMATSAAMQPSRSLILGCLLGMLLIAVASAAGSGAATFQKSLSNFSESRSVFYFMLLTGIFYAATATPGAVLWQVFGLCTVVLTMGAEALYGWAARRGEGRGVYRSVFTGLQLVLTVHLMICMFQFFRELPTHS